MPVPGASNINFAQGTRTPLNLAPEPGGTLVKAPSQALIPTGQPSSLPQVNPVSFAEPAPQPINFTNPKPLPNLQNLKPPTNPIPEPLPKPQAPIPKSPPTSPDIPKIRIPKVPSTVKAGVVVGSVLVNPATAANPIVPLKLGHAAVQIWGHNAHELMKLWDLSKPEPKFDDLELNEGEGQGNGIVYRVDYSISIYNASIKQNEIINQFDVVYGPVGGIRYNNRAFDSGVEILCKGRVADRKPILEQLEWVQVSFSSAGSQQATVTITGIRQLDQQGNPIQPTPTDPKPQPQRQPIPSIFGQPINQSPNQPQPKQQPLNNFPERLPFAEPEPETKKKPIKFAVPSNQPIQISAPGQPVIQVSPQPTAQPVKQPTIINIPTNTPTGQPQPVQVTSPGSSPTTFTSPSGAPVTINIPGQKPITYTPGQGQPDNTIRPIQQPDILVPESIQQPTIPIQKIKPIGDPPAGLEAQSRPKIPVTPETVGTNNKGQPVIFTPVTSTTPTTTPTTPTAPQPQPQPQPTPQPDPAKGFIPAPDAATIVLTGLTPFLQKLIEQTSKPAIADAVCSTTQPGNCTANLVNNAASNTNNKLDKLTAGLTGLDALQGLDTNTRVRNIEDKLGANEYPMILPEYLLNDSLDRQIVIPNQARYNEWLLKQIDALFGSFPIKIDKTNENGTTETLTLFNLAETLAEFVGIYSKIAFDADTAVNVGIRAVAEGIGARTAALQAGSYLKAIIDYLGFQTQHQSFPMQISCTIGAVGLDGNLQESELDDFLKPSTKNVIGLDCKEQDDLHTIIKRILFDAEIARAALYKPLKPDKINNKLSITGDGIRENRKKEQAKIDKKWEEFKKQIETQTNLPFKIDIDEKGTDPTP